MQMLMLPRSKLVQGSDTWKVVQRVVQTTIDVPRRLQAARASLSGHLRSLAHCLICTSRVEAYLLVFGRQTVCRIGKRQQLRPQQRLKQSWLPNGSVILVLPLGVYSLPQAKTIMSLVRISQKLMACL